ncbi:MAG: thioredoxin-like domain-containing protein, partial [Thermoguttaceae bacterium]
SGHNRILIVRFDGSVLATVGEGHRGAADGAFDKAQFNAPQGMALKDELLYVADTGNHLIRKVDLKQRAVFTIAGNGRQAFKPLSSTARPKPRKTALNSPWDLYIHGGNIFIAMAGSHQIWKMPLDESSIELFAGNGVEDIVDGRLLPNLPYQRGVASFAQPSGLTSDGLWLYVADAEGSSIRALPFNPKKFVRTIVGTARLPRSRLFTFGDTDGPPSQARLQHPLGIAYADGKLYIADTYNNKIKTIDRLTAETKTIAGDGTIGDSDKPPKFNNPSGLSWAVGKLFVADTNNHSIRVIEPRRGNKVSTLLK